MQQGERDQKKKDTPEPKAEEAVLDRNMTEHDMTDRQVVRLSSRNDTFDDIC